MDISNEFYDWFNVAGIDRGHLIPCWLAWEAAEKRGIIFTIPGKMVCAAPMNCKCGYQRTNTR